MKKSCVFYTGSKLKVQRTEHKGYFCLFLQTYFKCIPCGAWKTVCRSRGGYLELRCDPVRTAVWHVALRWWACTHALQEDPRRSVLHPWVPQSLCGKPGNAHASSGPSEESHNQRHQVRHSKRSGRKTSWNNRFLNSNINTTYKNKLVLTPSRCCIQYSSVMQ